MRKKVEATWGVLSVILLVLVVSVVGWTEEFRVPLEGDRRLELINKNGWEIMSKVEEGEYLNERMGFVVALKQRNMAELERYAYNVSDPTGKDYGKTMDKVEMMKLIAPLPESVQRVKDWLMVEGKISPEQMTLNPSGDFLSVTGVQIRNINMLLRVNLRPHSNKLRDNVRTIYRETQRHYTVPKSVADLIDYIGSIINFPKVISEFEQAPLIFSPPSGNGPIITLYLPGDEEIGAFLLMRCADGSPATGPKNNPCPGSPITSVGLRVRESFSYVDQSFQVPYSRLHCDSCQGYINNARSSFDTNSRACKTAVQYNNYNLSTVFCIVPADNKVRNYLPVTLTAFTVFGDTNSNDYTYPADIYAGAFVTPLTLTRRYNIPDNYQSIGGGSQSVAEFLGQYYDPADLTLFFKAMGISPAPVTLVGPNNASQPGGEASLDIQYMMGIAQNVTTTFWSINQTNDGQEAFDVWMASVLNSNNPPTVHSISYGDDESSLSLAYMNRVNNEFIKAASRRLSIIFSSGDSGVNSGANASVACSGNKFSPAFPAGSPWVTAVGATQFSTQTRRVCNADTSDKIGVRCEEVGEIGSSIRTGSRITSGGGFSNVFKPQPFQVPILNNYISQYTKNIPSGYFNTSGRGYPDVSACGRNFVVVLGKEYVPVDGTSCAAPTFGAVVSLLNGVLLSEGKPVLGFLNPMIYSTPFYPGAFNDIVMGKNECGFAACCKYGFEAEIGWDPVTGFGTPNFGAILKLLPLIVNSK
eukprot:TRINITY_DN1635_c0_g1_i2.p1 TRINITY_DN1635_c0_g1~~TRINITY_DN1635_c0_g1_i2.p1  ORF type:complete len:763 (-),score=189.59 TRINITY_DN1635_c0_g1_i2:19-2283(-)